MLFKKEGVIIIFVDNETYLSYVSVNLTLRLGNGKTIKKI